MLKLNISFTKEPEDGDIAMVAGWGMTDPDTSKRPLELQVVDVNIVNSEKCTQWHHQNKIEVTAPFLKNIKPFFSSPLCS